MAKETTPSELAGALIQAMEAVKPPTKKTPFNRTKRTPWTPKDGSPKLKLKRKMYQHAIQLTEDTLKNEDIALMNKLRPGSYCEGNITITRRRDKGLDIDYPFKTASQKLKLVNRFGLGNLTQILERCVQEANQPKKKEVEDE